MSPDVAASVKARLLALAKAEGEEFERTLVRFASERMLYRLGASRARRRCLLKGASLLSVWLPDPYRMTRDVDLLAFGAVDEAAIRALVEEICAVPCPDDGLSFDLSALTVEAIRAEEEYVGRRVRLVARLGSARIRVQLDFGVGDAVGPPPEEIEYPVLLPDLAAPRVRAYPREATIAEKLEAMVKLDVRNSRMKDFHDVWALSRECAFEGSVLRDALVQCFARRQRAWTAEAPRALTPGFYATPEPAARWRSYVKGGDVLKPPPQDFGVVGEGILAFLGPVRESIVAQREFRLGWPAGGPWRVEGASTEGGEGDG